MPKKKPAKVLHKREGNFVMLQVNGTTLQGLWRELTGERNRIYYRSDTFGRQYGSLSEAKEHTLELAKEGHFGEVFQLAVTGDSDEDSG